MFSAYFEMVIVVLICFPVMKGLDLLALLCVMFSCVFVTFPYGVALNYIDSQSLSSSLLYRHASKEQNILNKSENTTPELFATYIQNYANQECN